MPYVTSLSEEQLKEIITSFCNGNPVGKITSQYKIGYRRLVKILANNNIVYTPSSLPGENLKHITPEQREKIHLKWYILFR